GEEIIERLDPVARHDNLICDIALGERTERQVHIVRVVFDQQYFVHCSSLVGSGSIVKEKHAPASTPPSAHTRPPCRWTMRCTVASPMPVPGKSLTACRRWNAPNNLSAY